MGKTDEWIYELKVILMDGDSFLFYDTMANLIEKMNGLYGTVKKATFKVAQK